jgi:hypothetical protein
MGSHDHPRNLYKVRRLSPAVGLVSAVGATVAWASFWPVSSFTTLEPTSFTTISIPHGFGTWQGGLGLGAAIGVIVGLALFAKGLRVRVLGACVAVAASVVLLVDSGTAAVAAYHSYQSLNKIGSLVATGVSRSSLLPSAGVFLAGVFALFASLDVAFDCRRYALHLRSLRTAGAPHLAGEGSDPNLGGSAAPTVVPSFASPGVEIPTAIPDVTPAALVPVTERDPQPVMTDRLGRDEPLFHPVPLGEASNSVSPARPAPPPTFKVARVDARGPGVRHSRRRVSPGRWRPRRRMSGLQSIQ